MRATIAIFATAILVMAHGSNALAQDSRWVVRGFGSYLVTANDDSPVNTTNPPPVGDESIFQSVDEGAAAGFAVEYMWRDRIGIEGAAFLSGHDSVMTIANDQGTFSATDSTRFRTFTFGANYYLDTNGPMRWMLGGFVPLLFADGTDHSFPALNRVESRAYDQDYGVGIKAGLERPFAPGSPWMLSVEARYMLLLIMESETAGDVDVDPAMLSVGIGYRF